MDTLVLVKRTGQDVLAVKAQVDREAMQALGNWQYKPFHTIPPIKAERRVLNYQITKRDD
jgi:hypothetical protein